MPRYEYRGDGIRIRVTHPAPEGGIGIRIEHRSGAALIVASNPAEVSDHGLQSAVTGFDGTRFDLEVRSDWGLVEVRASVPTPILGGTTHTVATRRPELERNKTRVRMSGDEATMPIPVEDD